MLGSGIGSWFANLFCSAVTLAKNKLYRLPRIFASSTLHDWGSGKN